MKKNTDADEMTQCRFPNKECQASIKQCLGRGIGVFKRTFTMQTRKKISKKAFGKAILTYVLDNDDLLLGLKFRIRAHRPGCSYVWMRVGYRSTGS